MGHEVPEAASRWSGLEGILGSLFAPMAWLIGIESADCRAAGQLMGLKMATNEFVAYGRLAEWTPLGRRRRRQRRRSSATGPARS